MRAKITTNFKVWDIKEDPNSKDVSLVRVSESRKVRDNNYDKNLEAHEIAKNGYVSTNWYDFRFIGKAHNQLNKYVQVGDTITNLDATLEKEPYWDENSQSIAYPKNVRITVFEFELPGGSEEEGQPAKTPKNIDRAPRIADPEPEVEEPEYDDDENPF